MRRLIVLLLCLVAFFIPVQAQTYNPTCGDGSALASNVSDANNNATNDIINLSANCTYAITGTLTINDNGTLTINGNGATIQGDGTGSVFLLNANANLTLNDLTITGGDSIQGGGVQNLGGIVTITDSTITGNNATSDGGGIYNTLGFLNAIGRITISNSTISNNTAANGGGIRDNSWAGDSSTVLTITETTITGNTASNEGAGLYNDRGKVEIIRSTIDNNTATNDGGGLFDAGSGTVTISNSTIAENTTTSGGGGGIVSVNTTRFDLIDTTVAHNQASTFGGGIYNRSGNPWLYLQNTLVANNNASTGPDIYGEIQSLDYNFIGSVNDTIIEGTTTNNQTGDPLLDAGLSNNGGATQTVMILPGSPAIDKGSCAVTVDQRNFPRPLDFAGISNANVGCDIGAVERENTPPTIMNDLYPASTSVTLSVAAPGVLGNDNDVDSDPLTVILVSGPSHGTLTSLNPDGSFVYRANMGYIGLDSFTYIASDGRAESAPATVTLDVKNLPPEVQPDSYSVFSGGTLSVGAPGVLSNDNDPEGAILTATLGSTVQHGNLTLTTSGSFLYTPAVGFVGQDSFTYTASDGTNTSTPATVTITVNPATPIANDDDYATAEGVPLYVQIPGVLGNDQHPNNVQLSAVLVTSTSSGTLDFETDGSFTYTPNPGFEGSDTFTYKATDGSDESDPATVTIVVQDIIAPIPTSLSTQGSLSATPIQLTYRWRHQTVAGQTSVPGEWYNLYITKDGIVILDEWFPVEQVCVGLNCAITPGYDLLPAGLLNGIHRWRVRAWANNTFTDWSDTQSFTVTAPFPQLPQGFTVTTNQGRPSVTIQNDPGAAWFQIYVGTIDGGFVNVDWYRKTPDLCNSKDCTFDLNAHPLNGDHVVYILAWGPVGFSLGGFEGWGGPVNFNVQFDAPNIVTALNAIHTNSGRPTFSWESQTGATWYFLQILEQGEPVHQQWYSGLEMGCASLPAKLPDCTQLSFGEWQNLCLASGGLGAGWIQQSVGGWPEHRGQCDCPNHAITHDAHQHRHHLNANVHLGACPEYVVV